MVSISCCHTEYGRRSLIPTDVRSFPQTVSNYRRRSLIPSDARSFPQTFAHSLRRSLITADVQSFPQTFAHSRSLRETKTEWSKSLFICGNEANPLRAPITGYRGMWVKWPWYLIYRGRAYRYQMTWQVGIFGVPKTFWGQFRQNLYHKIARANTFTQFLHGF